MTHYIDKDALVAEIEKQRQLIFPQNTGEMKVADVPKPLEQGWLNALSWMKKTIDSLEVKEVDLNEYINKYFKGWYVDLTDQGNILHTPDGNASLMLVKEVAKHFFELGLKAKNK